MLDFTTGLMRLLLLGVGALSGGALTCSVAARFYRAASPADAGFCGAPRRRRFVSAHFRDGVIATSTASPRGIPNAPSPRRRREAPWSPADAGLCGAFLVLMPGGVAAAFRPTFAMA